MAKKNAAKKLTIAKKMNASDKILAQTITRISQKINLDAEIKKQISDFILERIELGNKVEFLKDFPAGNYVSLKEYKVKDYTMAPNIIHIMLDSKYMDDKYDGTIYVVIKKEEKVVEQPRIELKHTLSDFSYDNIFYGIITRMKETLREQGITMDESSQIQLDYFFAPKVEGRVWVEFVEELPTSLEYQRTQILLGNHLVTLAFGKNTIGKKFPHVLYICVREAYDIKFKEFWKKNYFPTALLEEAMSLLNLKNKIEIVVYERPSFWLTALHASKNTVLIGQQMDQNGNFNRRQPIGFVSSDNFLAFTWPNEHVIVEGYSYTYE